MGLPQAVLWICYGKKPEEDPETELWYAAVNRGSEEVPHWSVSSHGCHISPRVGRSIQQVNIVHVYLSQILNLESTSRLAINISHVQSTMNTLNCTFCCQYTYSTSEFSTFVSCIKVFLTEIINILLLKKSLNYKSRKIILYVCDHIKGLITIVVKFYNVSFYGVPGYWEH